VEAADLVATVTRAKIAAMHEIVRARDRSITIKLEYQQKKCEPGWVLLCKQSPLVAKMVTVIQVSSTLYCAHGGYRACPWPCL
jgi:hypothetical protein